jgi:hypothetical protein
MFNLKEKKMVMPDRRKFDWSIWIFGAVVGLSIGLISGIFISKQPERKEVLFSMPINGIHSAGYGIADFKSHSSWAERPYISIMHGETSAEDALKKVRRRNAQDYADGKDGDGNVLVEVYYREVYPWQL